MSFTANETGGEYKHTLTIAEMPVHGHGYKLAYGGNEPIKGFNYGNTYAGNFDDSSQYINNNGGSQPHNNIPPYITVYFWKRTS